MKAHILFTLGVLLAGGYYYFYWVDSTEYVLAELPAYIEGATAPSMKSFETY